MPMTIAFSETGILMNPSSSAPADFDVAKDLPGGFWDFFLPLHRIFTPRQQELARQRAEVLDASLGGSKPAHRFPSDTVRNGWKITLPAWCRDQRNQMTGPADDAELCVKMLNSGAPGVMLDLEDSCVNEWNHHQTGVTNILACLQGELTYYDKRRQRRVEIQPSGTVIFTRPRGLHMNQAGLIPNQMVSASLFDVARVFFGVDPAALKHPLCFYIPKSESAEEALWWRDLFQELAKWRGMPHDSIKCMALVEAHPLAFQMEEFAYNLREHLIGLDLGRWDYMASLIHFNLDDPDWVLPDRNTIPARCAFFSELARADAGDLSPSRHSGHWGDDCTVSQPRRCRVECSRSRGSRKGQEERSRLPDGWRLDGTSGPERDCGGAIPLPEPDARASEECKPLSRFAACTKKRRATYG